MSEVDYDEVTKVDQGPDYDVVSNNDSEMMRLGSDHTSMYKIGDDATSNNSFMTDMKRIDRGGSIVSGSSGSYMQRVPNGGQSNYDDNDSVYRMDDEDYPTNLESPSGHLQMNKIPSSTRGQSTHSKNLSQVDIMLSQGNSMTRSSTNKLLVRKVNDDELIEVERLEDNESLLF